jgi:hypothetical protein
VSVWSTLGGTSRRREVTALTTLLVVALAAVIFVMRASRSAPLYIVNGLDVAVVVQVGERTTVVEPQSKSVLVLRNGPYLATTKTRDGKLVERAIVVANSHPDAVVYNVLGAAPLVDARLRYSAGPKRDDRQREVTFHGGHSFSVIEDLDYVFTDPPQTISAEKSSGEIVKQVLMVPKGGWSGTATYLLGEGRAPEAFELQRALIRFDPTSLRAMSYAGEAAYAAYGGDEPIVSLLGPIVRAQPITDEDLLARYLLSESCRVDCEDGVKIVSDPGIRDTVARKLTLMRAQDEADARRVLSELSASNARDANVLRARGWLASSDGKWSECADLFERASSAPYADFDVEERAVCLHAAGRHADALAVAAHVADGSGEAAGNGAMTYARIAAAAGEPAGKYIQKIDDDPASQAATMGIWLGVFDRKAPKPPSDGTGAALALALAASTSADSAVEEAKKNPAAARRVPYVLAIVLGAELARRGDLTAAERVLDGARGLRLPSKAVIDYVLRGTVPRMMYRVDPEHRAALDFVRARRLEQLGLDSHLLYAAARSRDVLKGWVARLISAWAPPDRKNDALVYTSAPE